MNQNANQQKLGNTEKQIPKTPQMNERDFINDLLSTEKYMTTSYSVAMHEASHDGLFQDIQAIFNETEVCQRDLYNLMFKKGWYKIEPADQQQLQQTFQQFQGYTNQLPAGGQLQ
ncbi:MAG: spore coat protein [Bacillota bacterium]|nr:spore coat protein [Bacillota bacterium]